MKINKNFSFERQLKFKHIKIRHAVIVTLPQTFEIVPNVPLLHFNFLGPCLYFSNKHTNKSYFVYYTQHNCYDLPENLAGFEPGSSDPEAVSACAICTFFSNELFLPMSMQELTK
jgi:hypothetical protein